jgi:hypothetical protein
MKVRKKEIYVERKTEIRRRMQGNEEKSKRRQKGCKKGENR